MKKISLLILLFAFFWSGKDSFGQISVGRIADGEGGASLNRSSSVFVSGSYAYVGSLFGLEIVDVTNPTNPTHIGKIESGSAHSVYVAGNYAYVANGSFQIIDITNRSAPILKYTLGLNNAQAVFVSGYYAYVAGGDYSGNGFLQIVDVSNPALPVLVSSIRGSPTFNSIYVSGGYAYLTNNNLNNTQFQIVDVSNPTAPVLKGNMSFLGTSTMIDGSTTTDDYPHSVFVSGRYAFIAMAAGVEIVDVNNPTAPIRKGSWLCQTCGSLDVKAIGGYVYSSNHQLYTLDVIDFNNLSAPVLRARLPFGQASNGTGMNSIYVSGSYAYMTNNNGNSLEIIQISPLAPLAPVAAAVSSATQTSFDASWNPSVNATGYSVDVSTTQDFSSFVTGFENLSIGTNTSQNVTGLTASATYYFRVRAIGTGGVSLNSNVISVTLSAPGTPVAASATSPTYTSFAANWNPSTGATGYFLDVSTASDFSSIVSGYNNLSVGNLTSVNVTGLTAGTLYYYRVRATNAVGTSASSNVISLTLPSPPVPNIYVSSPANGATNLNVSLTVIATALTGATTYTIEISPDNTFTTGVISKSGTRSQAFSGLAYGTTYYARVKTDLSSVYGKTTSFTTGLPEQFTYVATPVNNAINQNVTLNIASTLVAGATTYTIEISPDNTFTTGVISKTGTTRTLSFSGLAYGTTYYARVKTDLSVNYGKTTSFTTGPPEQFTYVATPVNNAINQNVTLNIASTLVAGATTYTIEISPDNTFATGVISKTGATRILSFSGLAYGTTYYARVKTDLSSVYGKTTSFTTGLPEQFTYVATPVNNAINQNVTLNIASTLVAGATTYTIEISPDNTFATGVISKTGATRTLSFSGLAYGTTYYARVKTDLSVNYGKTTSFTTGPPELFTYVTSPANGGVNVGWNPSLTVTNIGASSYTVQLSTASDFSTIAAEQTGSSTTFKFTGLGYATKYYSRVTCNLALPGAWGPTRSFTTTTPETLSYIIAPLNGATNISYVTNVVANLVPDATLYTIELNPDVNFGTGTAIVKSSSSRTIGFSLTYNTTYYARVKTNLLDAWGTSIKSFTTGDPVSLAFVTSPKNGGTGVPTTVTVYSNIVPGASSYTIELNTAPDFSGTSLMKTSTVRYMSFSGLTVNTTYYTRVQTNIVPGWGITSTYFNTNVNPAARTNGDWHGDEEEEEVKLEPFDVKIFGNPFKERLTFLIEAPVQEKAAIGLYDITGKPVHQSEVQTNQIIDIDNVFVRGMYLLRVRTNSGIKVIRVLKED